MKCLLFLMAMSVTTTTVTAEPFQLTIPSQGWTMEFDAPFFRVFGGVVEDRSFRFQARGKDFVVTVFVEETPPKVDASSNEACFNHYWGRAKRNPMIDRKTITIEKGARFVKVFYTLKGTFEGKEITQSHANFYFTFNKRWVDVHVSIPGAKSLDTINDFEKSLSWEKRQD